jgi:hypothetical protein
MSNYKTIEHHKLIISTVDFHPSKQGGYINRETEIFKIDYNFENNEEQKTIIKRVLSWLDCDHESKVINKIIKDISKREYCVFTQIKSGLKTELLKTFSLKIEKTTSKQFQLI